MVHSISEGRSSEDFLDHFYFMAYIYRHIRLDKNEVFYIGIGSDKNYKRAHTKKNRNKYWHNIVNLTDYRVEIISEEWLTWEESCEKEKFWIIFYGRADLKKGTLVNMTDGGDGALGSILTEERKRLISKTHKGKKLTEDHKRKISISHKGISNGPCSEKTKKKRSIALTGKKRSKETKKKLSDAQRGKHYSEESRKKMSDLKKGEKNYNFGKPAHNRRKVINLETGEIYDSVKLASIINHIHKSTMNLLIKKGIRFKYY